MKNIILAIFLSISIYISSVSNAYAFGLVFDVANTAQDVTGAITNITEKVNRVQSYVANVKQKITQGVDKAALINQLKSMAISFGLSQARSYYIRHKMAQGTNDKDKAQVEKKKAKTKTGMLMQLNLKKAATEKNIELATEEINDLDSKISKLKSEINQLEQQEKTLEEKDANSEKLHKVRRKLEEKRSKLAEYEVQRADVVALRERFKKDLEKTNQDIKDVEDEGGDLGSRLKQFDRIITEIEQNDTKFSQRLSGRLNTISEKIDEELSDAEKQGLRPENEEGSWETEAFLEQYEPKQEDYIAFMQTYFYDPNKLSQDGEADADEQRLKNQNEMDEVSRYRRYAITAAAAHLIQVSGNLKRNIVSQRESVEKLTGEVAKASNAKSARSVYATAHIEEARSLLMFAKLLAAKLQYLAASELASTPIYKTPRKDGESMADYTVFTLDPYILTEYEVEKIKEANK